MSESVRYKVVYTATGEDFPDGYEIRMPSDRAVAWAATRVEAERIAAVLDRRDSVSDTEIDAAFSALYRKIDELFTLVFAARRKKP